MLLNLRDISLQFTDLPILDAVSLTIDEGERICLVGRNGAGKSTLLKVIARELEADSGEITHGSTLRISQLPQDIPENLHGTIYEVVTHGLGEIGKQLIAYDKARHGDDTAVIEKLQHALESAGAWDMTVQVDNIISRMELDAAADFDALSGGMKRRVLLARALAYDPDILLLDEPTNHLDIAAVQWLENFLLGANCALVFITHDRSFLDRIATRIVEVDRGKLYSWPGNFSEYRRRKAEALENERQANREFDKKLAEEEVWIRRGVKARTKRNQGRVRALESLREQAGDRQKYAQRAEIKAQFSEESSKRVIEARKLTASIGEQIILKDCDLKIRRGQNIGVMGPNGCGKTTLLRVLLDQHAPDSGRLIHGENLQIAYFDQTRSALDLDRPAFWNVSDGAERIEFNKKNMHVLGYLKAFLFTPERANTTTRLLSGGERNRLLLAKLFAQPSNVLVLDEPTNDLDIETLELLEDLMNSYPGTCILVSHDRTFVNNVVDGMLMQEGHEGFKFYVGNYEDYIRQSSHADAGPVSRKTSPSQVTKNRPPAKKLSYKDQRELDQLPLQIETLETELAQFHERMGTSGFFQQDAEIIREFQQKESELQTRLQQCFNRWEELEALQSERKG